jgi:hypothetical protein
MADHPNAELGRDRDEVAAYVAELTGELAEVTSQSGLDALGYLLDMARLEAENAARRLTPADASAKVARG